MCSTCVHTFITCCAPLFPLNSSPWFPLVHHEHPCRHTVFFDVCMHYKIPYTHSFVFLFALFLLPSLHMGLYAPIQTALYTSVPIYNGFSHTPQNMMSGEISPTIAPKSWSETPLIPPVCLVFVFCMTPLPQRTHTHP